MGYGYYELPSGKEAGYTVEATCEHPDCDEPIHRGMAYACGGDPGDQGGCACEGYFCYRHLHMVEPLTGTHARTELGAFAQLCAPCTALLAHLGVVDEAEYYVNDPKFALTEEMAEIVRKEKEIM